MKNVKLHFDYLDRFLPPHPDYEGTNINWFYPVEKSEILKAKQILGAELPSELLSFYEEIGYGCLYSPFDAPVGYSATVTNRIIPPVTAVKYYQLIFKHHSWVQAEGLSLDKLLNLNMFYNEADEDMISIETLEGLEPGDLPFFEISDSSSFMVMKLNSENPNAVWFMGHEKIEDSFERFIWRLYYEDPSYYTKNW